ncbi:efflux RND transporter permease subunit [Mycoplasmatota bacterium]|nr:efflux RND transporter permease subunit [Mycoplasmatota bacterium]
MKNIAKYSVNKPVSVLMGILIVILLGIVSITKLPLELFPDINLPFAVVVTTYEGKNPYEVEEDVTVPVEQNLLSINNLKTLQSTSREHFSIIIAEFEQSTNMDTAFLEIRESFQMLDLKEGAGNPMIIKFDPDMMPVMVVSLTRDWGDVSDEESLIKTTEWVKEDVLNKLERIPGVASVNLSGASDTEIQVDLDKDLLENYNLTQDEVLRIIKDQNISGLAGIVPDNNAIRMMYIGNKIVGLEGLKETPITYDSTNNKIITLNDLSTSIDFINAATNQYMKINGQQGISISFQKQSEVGITEVVQSIQKTLNEITGSDEYDAGYVELLNQGEYIEQSVGSVTSNIIIGSILAIIILFLFLRDIRPTLIVGLAIPISVIGAFSLMYAFNITLNIVSMGGLALGIGMLVDNSIVVIENIYRLLNQGKSPKEAAIAGASQVAGAITASTITTIAVFLPIVFIEGMTADLFTAMALTVTFSLVASLIIALTMVPSISARSLKQSNIKEDKISKKLQKWYEKIIIVVLRKKAISLIVVTLLLVLSIFLASLNGFELLPKTDEGTITVNVEMIKGTSFNKTTELTDKIVDEIMTIDDIKTVSAEVGGGGFGSMFGGTGATDTASITVLLKDNRTLSTEKIAKKIEEIRDELDYDQLDNINEKEVYKISVNSQSTTSMAGFGGTGIQLEIKGEDIYEMRNIANQLVSIIQEVKGTKDWDNGVVQTDDVVRIEVNKENAIKRGLTESDIRTAINNFYQSLGFSMTTTIDTSLIIKVNGIDYKISVPTNGFSGIDVNHQDFLRQISVFDYSVTKAIENKLAENDETFILYYLNIPFMDAERTIVNPLFNEDLPLRALLINPLVRYDEIKNEVYIPQQDEILTDTNPTLVSLIKGSVYEGNLDTSITNVKLEDGFGSITRDGKSRTMTVSAQVETGKVLSQVSKEVEDKVNAYLNSIEFKDSYGKHGYTVEFTGENTDINQTKHDMILAGVVAILLVYMVMAIKFQSLKYPFIVFFTIPLAFTGGLLALVITNLPISMVAMVGLIILSGIVVNNGIVLIDYINQLRESGKSIDKAIVEAGKTRLRPILMTALTTSLALIPLAIGFGEGGELLQPLGITAVGGLIYATLLTLIIVPIMYRVLNPKR